MLLMGSQARVTKESVAKIEKKIAAAEAKSKASSTNGTSTPAEPATPVKTKEAEVVEAEKPVVAAE